MISKIIYPNGRDYICDDCKNEVAKFKTYREALNAHWAIANGRKKCYCPVCAPAHRNTGRAGAPVPAEAQPDWVPAGYEQTKIKM